MTDELNEILKECAAIRGVHNLQHRILHEFDWFVGCIIWHKWEKFPEDEDCQKLKKYSSFEVKDCNNALLEWGKLFLDYYHEKEIEWNHQLDEEIKRG